MLKLTGRRAEIRRQYRLWRLNVGKNGLTQTEVGALARRHYPEFGTRRYEVIENGLDYPTPSERRALAKVLRVSEADLPSADAEIAKAS